MNGQRQAAIRCDRDEYRGVVDPAAREGVLTVVFDLRVGREVSPPEAGLAVNPADPAAIAGAVVRLLTSGPEWEHWSERARCRHTMQFTSMHFRRRLLSALLDDEPAMRALHVIPSVGAVRGGPSVMVHAGARFGHGVESHIATTDDNGRARLDVRLGEPVVEEGVTYWHFRRNPSPYFLMSTQCEHNVGNYDVVHIHALFSYAASPAAYWAQLSRRAVPRPAPRVLNRWGMANRRPALKKLSSEAGSSAVSAGRRPDPLHQ